MTDLCRDKRAGVPLVYIITDSGRTPVFFYFICFLQETSAGISVLHSNLFPEEDSILFAKKRKERIMMRRGLKNTAAVLMAFMLGGTMAACGQKADTPVTTPAPEETVTTEAAATTADTTAASTAADDDTDGELILDHEEELQYATEFTLTNYKGGYKKFTVAYHADKEFLIVPEGKKVPEDLADNVVVLQQPINKITMNSTGMVSLIDAIGGLDHIATVGTDIKGWYLDNVIAKMEAGDIKYSGNYKEPDFEMLAAEGIQLEIDTTMAAGNPDVLAKYDELGIPYFIESSSKEGTPLGRVEWVKLFGALMGMENEANTYFEEQVKKVDGVTAADKTDKTVAMFYISSGSDKVYARNGGDYMAAMIGMAGGNYIMADVEPEKTGNTAATFEDIYSRCIDADYIFYVNFALKFDSVEDLVAYNPLFGDFKAVKEGNVYITAPDFTQSTAAIAGIIEDMHAVLKDPTIETTDSLIKLK